MRHEHLADDDRGCAELAEWERTVRERAARLDFETVDTALQATARAVESAG
ncbi:hypothetical protein ACFV9D_27735 [Streptomyces sp. NPDC059875]|uniref:hypothetical protein n=1 Tax=unclassified Streptomyces TaxID=2593676 RepID=UPI0036491122